MPLVSLPIKSLNSNSCDVKEFSLPSIFKEVSLKNFSYSLRWQLAKRRSGSSSTKSMSELSGTTAKPLKQKGSGRARQGSRRSVQFVGGRTCHGPKPTCYNFSLPKNIFKLALLDAFAFKIKHDSLILIDESSTASKSKDFFLFMRRQELDRCLVIYSSKEDSIVRASRNIKGIKLVSVEGLNPYDMILCEKILLDSKLFNYILSSFVPKKAL